MNSIYKLLLIVVVVCVGGLHSICVPDKFIDARTECSTWQDILEITAPQPWRQLRVLRQEEPTVCEGSPFAVVPEVTLLLLQELSFTAIAADCFSGATASVDEIDLSQNQITRFDLAAVHNSTIAKLTLDHNKIKTLNFEGVSLPQLRHLKVRSNQLESLTLADDKGLPNIIQVNAVKNGIRDLRVSLNNLYSLFLSVNEIKVLDKEHIRGDSLEFLHIENNAFERLSLDWFSNLPRIREIHATHNNFSYFDCSSSNISKLTLTEESLIVEKSTKWGQSFFISLFWDKVDQLNVSHNALDEFSVPLASRGSFAVQELNLDHNRLKMIGTRAFSAMKNLFYLDLSHNRIESISRDAFKGLHKLHTLKINDNCLLQWDTATMDSLYSLITLNLARNLLTTYSLFNQSVDSYLVRFHVLVGKFLNNQHNFIVKARDVDATANSCGQSDEMQC